MVVSTAIEVRQRNIERIRKSMQSHDRCTKNDIARETALSMATCSNALNEMMKNGEVIKVDQTGFNIGRPADLFTYNKDYIHILALCTSVQEQKHIAEYAIADAMGNVLKRESMPVDNLNYVLLEGIVEACLVEDSRIKVVGLGIPGHARDGYIDELCDIPALRNMNFCEKLREKYPELGVVVENDMNFITYNLHPKHVKNNENFATMYIPMGEDSCVGCGFIVNGKLLKGHSMLSGELSYAAQLFGLARSEQNKFREDRAKFQDFVAKMVGIVACTINPKCLILMGDDVRESDIKEIEKLCKAVFPEDGVPELGVDNNLFDNYIEGLIRYTLDSVMYPILNE